MGHWPTPARRLVLLALCSLGGGEVALAADAGLGVAVEQTPVEQSTTLPAPEPHDPPETSAPAPAEQPPVEPVESEHLELDPAGVAPEDDPEPAPPPEDGLKPADKEPSVGALVVIEERPRTETSALDRTSAHEAATKDRRDDFERACGERPRSGACRDFLAPRACGPGNVFNDNPGQHGSCGYLLRIHPCRDDPRSTACRQFLENPCFLRPRGPSCLGFVGRPFPSGCSFEDPQVSVECQVAVVAMLDLCEAGSELCDSPFGGSQEVLAFVPSGGGSRSPGEDPASSPLAGLELASVQPGIAPTGGRARGRRAPLPATGLELLPIAALGLGSGGIGLLLLVVAGRRRLRTSVALAAGALALYSVTPAAAYEISSAAIRWPFDTITYHVPRGPQAAPIDRGVQAWDRARTGWRLRRVGSRAAADIVFELQLTRRRDVCRGGAVKGFRFGQTRIVLYGRCYDHGLLTLGAAHEVGHVLGLAEERRRCAVMNPNFTGTGRDVRPVGCRAGPAYWSEPVRRDDRRGARTMHARRLTSTPSLCNPPDEQPILAQDPFCKYSYSCDSVSGLHGRNLDEGKIGAYIRERCGRLLRVLRLPAGRETGPGRRRPEAEGSYSGTTTQGLRVRFSVRDGRVRGFRIRARFGCNDGVELYERPSVDGAAPTEDLGPFPSFVASGDRFGRAFEPPNETVHYEIAASFAGGAWRGRFRTVERWSRNGRPHPDGAITCDTGRVEFVARR
jgi:hypothetical protein